MTSRQQVAQGGMFGASSLPPMSNQTKELLKVMMEESKLSNFQRRKLNDSIKSGRSLPVRVPPTCSERTQHAESFPPPQKAFSMVGVPMSSMRSREVIEESGAYDRPQFTPKPTRSLEREKERLSNLMAYGEDVKPKSQQEILKARRVKEENVVKVDRFDEIQNEIEERKKFLDSMEKAGQGKKHRPVIALQISQLIREMEVIDKKRTGELVEALNKIEEKKENS